ncbi:MAG: hypothetical protein O2955_13595 [Planctomycetota bacterium]|nr:hypothetical protein [Planctomycetota bacterium]MDA1213543.1 hypothetical protein [Planctomycetota bacterium]
MTSTKRVEQSKGKETFAKIQAAGVEVNEPIQRAKQSEPANVSADISGSETGVACDVACHCRLVQQCPSRYR